MKNFGSAEKAKAVEILVDSVSKIKRHLPIEFTADGIPAESKRIESTNEKDDAPKKIALSVGSKEQGNYMDINMDIYNYKFINQDNKEVFAELPALATTDPEEFLKMAAKITEVFIAVRNAALTMTAINPLFVENSTVTPPTGIVLADILSNTGRLEARTAVKRVFEDSDLEQSKVNAAISDYNLNKNVNVFIENIGYATALNFKKGCEALAKQIPHLKHKGAGLENISRTSESKPILTQRSTGTLNEVERREATTKKNISSLIH